MDKRKGYPYSLSTDEYEQRHNQLRDNAWLLIRDLVNKEPHIYEKKYRSKAINKVCETHTISYHTIRKYLYKYWSTGKTINALLPDYNKSGALGKVRNAGEKKRGRPRKYQGIGINVDESTKEVFRKAINKYYLTSKQNSLTVAYKLMLREFYTEDIYYSAGIEKLILKDEDEIPTLEQFKYWFNKETRVQSGSSTASWTLFMRGSV
ncbi:hypothetical protein ACFP56_21390 [Paenibacillus septentrionalis]|uniref:Helix-turn-helix domain-containing protein n=1 Tax=Paenibacillus septentrionalis TaxID=429342 RepID=A0ABW1V9P6_9BACL